MASLPGTPRERFCPGERPACRRPTYHSCPVSSPIVNGIEEQIQNETLGGIEERGENETLGSMLSHLEWLLDNHEFKYATGLIKFMITHQDLGDVQILISKEKFKRELQMCVDNFEPVSPGAGLLARLQLAAARSKRQPKKTFRRRHWNLRTVDGVNPEGALNKPGDSYHEQPNCGINADGYSRENVSLEIERDGQEDSDDQENQIPVSLVHEKSPSWQISDAHGGPVSSDSVISRPPTKDQSAPCTVYQESWQMCTSDTNKDEDEALKGLHEGNRLQLFKALRHRRLR
jgi:hypothetical protein